MIAPPTPTTNVQILRCREHCRIISRCWEAGADPDPLMVFEELPELLACDESIRSLLQLACKIERQRGPSIRWTEIATVFPQLRELVESIRTSKALDAPIRAAAEPEVANPFPEELVRRGYRTVRALSGCDWLGVDTRHGGPRLMRVCAGRWPSERAGAEGYHPGIVPFLEAGRTTDGRGWAILQLCGTLTFAGLLERLSREKRRPLRASFIDDCVRDAIPVELDLQRYWQPQPILTRCSFADGIVWLGAQIAAALNHLHRRGLSFGTLTAENVLLSFQGQPMLVGHGWESSTPADDTFALGELLKELLGVNRPIKPGSAGFDLRISTRLLRLFQLCELGEIGCGELIEELPKCLSQGLRMREWDEASDLFGEAQLEESPSRMG